MVLSKKVARFNRLATNRVLGPLSMWLPGFAMIVHRGRRSGRTYRTPVKIFRVADSLVVALTYGPDSDWVRNVLAAGGCEIETRRRIMTATRPRVVRDERRTGMPPGVRQILGAAGVTEFLFLDRVS
ncbi:nitroreductase family deazaflavin-dependent oxidoreductase [Amycolatopsis granulosa]|uniref:nitroreductase family deazaflavin-dependent oxidoreductase n=1 Tax=Amycolatopsis granulosa TaxID=185684 RepID=UPI00141F34FF|nr:nitroreductase family deazaflavin-dependent oxidoreductase [Amycolatopsis granulosa]NIH84217.1 deazaflavin-dependent oxidoreductase (nitroreductase family) [Amycolatopsis granulosa]